MTSPGLARGILAFLDHITVLPRRLSLSTPGVRATAPMIRGVWGAALHNLDRSAYNAVFAREEKERGDTNPSYIVRPAPPDPKDSPALEWILIGEAIGYDETLLEAWRAAAMMGLGKKRQPFSLRKIRRIEPDGALGGSDGGGWPLGKARWPLKGDPASTPCRLVFPAPLRILRRGRLIGRPSLKDIVVAAARRVERSLPHSLGAVFREFRPLLLELAGNIPKDEWRGARLDLVRYSASQDKELVLQGVSGYLDLPSGPGELWPVLLAAQWIHAGKGSIVGMGQLVIESPSRG